MGRQSCKSLQQIQAPNLGDQDAGQHRIVCKSAKGKMRIAPLAKRLIVSGELLLAGGLHSIDDAKKKRGRKRMTQLAEGIQQGLTDWHTTEHKHLDELEKIEEDLRCNNHKYAFPSVLSDYGKDFNPVFALHMEAEDAARTSRSGHPMTQQQHFALNKAKALAEELTGLLKADENTVHQFEGRVAQTPSHNVNEAWRKARELRYKISLARRFFERLSSQ